MFEMMQGTKGGNDYVVVARREYDGRTYVMGVKPILDASPKAVVLGVRVRVTPEEYVGGLSKAETKAALKFSATADNIFHAFPLPFDKLDGVRGSVSRAALVTIPPTAPAERFADASQSFSAAFLQALRETLSLPKIEEEEALQAWIVGTWMDEIQTVRLMIEAQKSGQVLAFPGTEKH